jgi:hypothetical protein
MAAGVAAATVIREMQQAADKQLDTMYKTVGLVKDVGYSKFVTQLLRHAWSYNWDPAILDFTVLALTTAQIATADALVTPAATKARLDRRNAFLVILHSTDGHPAENLLETAVPGDPRAAFSTLRQYFHPNTTAGLQGAYVNFFTTTMSTSGTTIVEWVSTVSRNAKVVRDSGGQADETAEISVLLKGLLPEFKGIRTMLNQRPALTLAVTVPALMDYAADENLLHLKKGGSTQKQNNVFIAADAAEHPPGECRNWKLYRCTFGDKCRFKHVGEGASISPNENRKR